MIEVWNVILSKINTVNGIYRYQSRIGTNIKYKLDKPNEVEKYYRFAYGEEPEMAVLFNSVDVLILDITFYIIIGDLVFNGSSKLSDINVTISNFIRNGKNKQNQYIDKLLKKYMVISIGSYKNCLIKCFLLATAMKLGKKISEKSIKKKASKIRNQLKGLDQKEIIKWLQTKYKVHVKFYNVVEPDNT